MAKATSMTQAEREEFLGCLTALSKWVWGSDGDDHTKEISHYIPYWSEQWTTIEKTAAEPVVILITKYREEALAWAKLNQ